MFARPGRFVQPRTSEAPEIALSGLWQPRELPGEVAHRPQPEGRLAGQVQVAHKVPVPEPQVAQGR